MILKVSLEDSKGIEFTVKYGQNLETYDVIGEVDSEPECDYEELTEEFKEFTQLCVPPVFKTKKPTISEIKEVKEMCDYIGEEAYAASTMNELELMYKNSLLEDEVDTLALEILDLKGV